MQVGVSNRRRENIAHTTGKVVSCGMCSTVLQAIPDGGNVHPIHRSPGAEMDDVNFRTDEAIG